MKRTLLAFFCSVTMTGCSPANWPLLGQAGANWVALLYVGFQASPQWLDSIYSERWPELTEALRLHHPDEYWAALRDVIAAFQAGEEISNPLPAQFGHYAALASDATHQRVFGLYYGYLEDGLARGEDLCWTDEAYGPEFDIARDAFANAIAEGITAPVQRPDASVLGGVALMGELTKRGLDLHKLQAVPAGNYYPEACNDYVTYLETLNSLELEQARVLRAQIIGAIAPNM